MRGGVNDYTSMDTITAAATAIVTAEARVQQSTSVQKRRWGSCWSGYWCFGAQRNRKRIGHAVLTPEPMSGSAAAPGAEISFRPPSIILPFAAPPSSPASFLQSDPNSSTQSPAGLLSFTSFSANVYSPGPNSIFAIGPYAHEKNLVSPPVFSTFTTEPSTAPFTPPPETVQLTTPSSPEVPFAQLLSSSLDPNLRNHDPNQNFPLSHHEFQSYQLYPGSPVGQLISPSSVRSGASSPFPDSEFNSGGRTYLEFHTGDVPKLWNIKGLSTSKWVTTRQSSGSLTPDPAGPPANERDFLLENQIPEGTGDDSNLWNMNGLSASNWVTRTRQSSGSLTPDPAGPTSNYKEFLSENQISEGTGDVSNLWNLNELSASRWVTRTRQSSGSRTPDLAVAFYDKEFILANQISEVASLANSDNGSEINDSLINHRVSFELNAMEVATCLEKELGVPLRTISEASPASAVNASTPERDGHPPNQTEGPTSNDLAEKDSVDGEEEQLHIQQPSVLTSVGSVKEFKFENSDGGTSDKPDWWAKENVVTKESGPHDNWTFFPVLQPGVS
ncbi:hypothetical protein MKW98_015893 [Papaver atlanticum]|uniref:Hydroxyproline-rich glycoprotein family protein n=1 Tax=Papaver atlanticum TaxID=357466 RepID=A0AAD4SU28_9MAGN|nr:hypothetical protein MKW98_015893 [Papaver atlanticum]